MANVTTAGSLPDSEVSNANAYPPHQRLPTSTFIVNIYSVSSCPLLSSSLTSHSCGVELAMAALQIFLTTVLLAALLTIGGAIRRLFLHPLAHMPGPRLAALTWWYEFYFDAIQPGQYVFKIQELHKRYGKPKYVRTCISPRSITDLPRKDQSSGLPRTRFTSLMLGSSTPSMPLLRPRETSMSTN